MLDMVVSRLKMRDELVKVVRLLLGLSPAIIADLPSPIEATDDNARLTVPAETEAHSK